MSFKVGDRIRCDDAADSKGQLVKGQEYTVSGHTPTGNLKLVNVPLMWSDKRFSLVSATTETLEAPEPYGVWVTGPGHVTDLWCAFSPTPRDKPDQLSGTLAEARLCQERMAKDFPATTYTIYHYHPDGPLAFRSRPPPETRDLYSFFSTPSDPNQCKCGILKSECRYHKE